MWRILAYIVATADLGVLSVAAAVSAWCSLTVAADFLYLAIVPLAIAGLQGLMAVYLLARGRTRLLLGWCLGSLAGLIGGLILLVLLGVVALKTGHGTLAAAVLLMAVAPQLVFSVGPLAGLLLVWICQRLAVLAARAR